MINDVAMSGEPADILSTINPNTVESIEVTTRVNVLYGSSGQSRVISIHTKQGLNPIKEITPDFIELKKYPVIRAQDHLRILIMTKRGNRCI